MKIDRAMLWCQLSSGADDETRRASWGIQNGWAWFADQHVWPWIEAQRNAGRTRSRVLLHLPFGRTVTPNQKAMAVDEYIQALARGQTFWYAEFVDAIGSIARAGHEVIAYLGRPGLTRSVVDQIDTPGRKDNVLRLVWRSLRLPLEAGCNLAFDNMGSEWIKPIDVGVYETCAAMCRCYVEATPQYGHRFEQEPAIIRWPLFLRRHVQPQHPAVVGKWSVWDSPDYPSRETIVLAAGNEEHERMTEWFAENKDTRFVPAVTIGWSKRLIEELA